MGRDFFTINPSLVNFDFYIQPAASARSSIQQHEALFQFLETPLQQVQIS